MENIIEQMDNQISLNEIIAENEGFYPTPPKIIELLVEDIGFGDEPVLEPSAGDGAIISHIREKTFRVGRWSEKINKFRMDCLETDPKLRAILNEKKCNVVGDDFLAFHTRKEYGAIVMNPPFSEGDKHLLKAISLMEHGGKIRCILNAETIKNPFSNRRKLLNQKLNELNASVEFIQDAFVESARPTSVEIALIKIDIPKMNENSIILENLKLRTKLYNTEFNSSEMIVLSDELTNLVSDYNYAIDAGISLIKEFSKLSCLFLGTLELNAKDYFENRSNIPRINEFIEEMRLRYWDKIFMSDSFKNMTSDMQKELRSMLPKLKDYDISTYNITTIKAQVHEQLYDGVFKAIEKVFDLFTSYSIHYGSKNIHYFNGWKTNRAHKITKKVIVPMNGAHSEAEWSCFRYSKIYDRLKDIELALSYLFNNKYEGKNLEDVVNEVDLKKLNEFETKFFSVKIYKKGTAHLIFKDDNVLDKLNLFGARQKKWLPPSYGYKPYEEMDPEERHVIDSFQGETAYKAYCEQCDEEKLNEINNRLAIAG